MEKKFKFQKDVQYFLGVMKWSLVALQMQEDNREDMLEILTKPDKIDEVAQEYGMDHITLLQELVRLSKEAEDVLGFYEDLAKISKKEEDKEIQE